MSNIPKSKRKRLKAYKGLLDRKVLTIEDVVFAYKTWLGTVSKPLRDRHRNNLSKRMYKNYFQIQRINNFFFHLFNEELLKCQIQLN